MGRAQLRPSAYADVGGAFLGNPGRKSGRDEVKAKPGCTVILPNGTEPHAVCDHCMIGGNQASGPVLANHSAAFSRSSLSQTQLGEHAHTRDRTMDVPNVGGNGDGKNSKQTKKNPGREG